MRRIILSAVVVLAASSAVSADWPMWGGTPSRNMVSTMTGLPTTWDVKTGKNVKWVAELGSQSYGNPTVAERRRDDRHQQRSDARSETARRSRRADGVQRGDRRVHVAGDVREAVVGPRQRLAVPGHRQLADGAARRGLLHVQPRHDHRRRPQGLSRRRERRSVQGREADRQDRHRHHLDVRHDGRGRLVPAQPRELLAGDRRRPAVLQHRQRPGRKPRQHSVAEGAVDHRDRDRERQAEVGRQLGRREASCTASGRRRRSATSAACARSCTRRATAGCAATKRSPARSCGSSTPTRRTRCGRRPATK